MNRGMEHHRASNQHDRLDRPLGNSIVVMGPDAGEANRPLEGRQMVGEGLRRDGLSVVGLVILRDDANITTEKLVLFFGSKGFVGVQMHLKLDVNLARRVIDEDTAAHVEIAIVRPATGGEEASFCRANEVINRNALNREEVGPAKGVNSIDDDGTASSGGGSHPLLGNRWRTLAGAESLRKQHEGVEHFPSWR